MTDQTKVTLTPDQIKARQAALDAANATATPSKPATPQVTALPGMAPLGLKSVSEAVANATVIIDKPNATPNPANVPPVSAKPEGMPNTAPAAKPASEAPKATADHAAAIAKANANTGKAPQGGTVTGNRGAPKAATPKVTPTVSAAKPEKLGKVATAIAAQPDTGGYQLAKWPTALPAPSKVDIAVANALGTMTREFTKQGLALSFYLSAKAGSVTTNDAAIAFCDVFGGKIDPKLNVINQRLVPSGLGYVVKGSAASVYPGAKRGTTYKAYLTPKGVAAVTKLLDAQKLKVPAYMLPPVEKGGKAPAGVTNAGKPNQATAPA